MFESRDAVSCDAVMEQSQEADRSKVKSALMMDHHNTRYPLTIHTGALGTVTSSQHW